MNSKIKYLFASTTKLLTRKGLSCPSCGSQKSSVVSRKYCVTALRRCHACQLLFRAPTTSLEENRSFYQSEYAQGFTSDMPSVAQLDNLKASGFKGSEKDYSQYIQVLTAIGCNPGDTLLDFGCSWGYGSWQFVQAGYTVTAYEISIPRCEFARENLGIDAHARIEDIRGPFDIFFSAHVLEHVPSVSATIEFARKMVNPGGWFVAFTPNGSDAYKMKHPKEWNQRWGFVHPNFLDDRFYAHAFKSGIYLLASCPYDLATIEQWAVSPQNNRILDLSGDELIMVARIM